jgi:hypothetical protein
VLFEKLVKQHCVHRFVANAVRFLPWHTPPDWIHERLLRIVAKPIEAVRRNEAQSSLEQFYLFDRRFKVDLRDEGALKALLSSKGQKESGRKQR